MQHQHRWAIAVILALAVGCSSRAQEPGDEPQAPAATPDGASPALTSPASSPGQGAAPDARAASPDGAGTADAAATEASVRLDTARDAAPAPAPAPRPAHCLKDADCMLVNDCCTCAAIVKGERTPPCDPKTACLIPKCAEYGGVEQARCVVGRCVLGFDCDVASVTCRRAPPNCPSGQVPRVVTTGGQRCFGDCVDARQCLGVPNCAACAKGDLCLRAVPSPQPLHCVRPPTACEVGSAGCGCPGLCPAPFSVCQAGPPPAALTCECPNC